MTARIWALGLAALPLVACKPKAESQAPHRDVHGWTLAEIEAELARNDAVLAGEGIMVAVAPTPTIAPPNVSGVEFEQPVTEPEGETTDPEPGGDVDDGSDPGEDPQASPPEPEPMPTTAARPESQPVYGAEELTSVAPDSAAERRRANKRRLSTRSRREASTRCERLCGLAEATCELETQICELAASHPGESRYQQACLRAEQQCIAASEACQRCEE
jgi:hypothetical protein